MKIRQLSNQLLVTIILICSCNEIWAGLVAKGAGKSKNSTLTSKESNSTTKQPKQHKTKTTTTTTTTTTSKPELETTTLPGDLDLDGRSAYINNQYVADPEEPLPDTSPPLYELLQQQMETVLSNTGANIQIYNNDSPQMKEALDNVGSETQKPPGKPLFAYDLGQFDDYDEEEEEEGNEYGAEGDYIPDNCEDTQESLGDNDNGVYASNLPALQNSYAQVNVDNKPYDSSNYAPQNSNNPGSLYNNQNSNKPTDIQNNYNSPTNTNQASNYGNNKPQTNFGSTLITQQYNQHNLNLKPAQKTSTKPKPSNSLNNQNNYGQYQNPPQTNPTNNYGQYTQNNQKPQTNQKPSQRPSYNPSKTPQNSYNTQKPISSGNTKPYNKPSQQQSSKPIYTKPQQVLNNKPSYQYSTTTSSNPNYNYNNTETLTSAYGSFNPQTTSSYTSGQTHSLNPSLTPNFSYGNSNTQNSSPFSTTSNYQGKVPHGQKRHLMFRTVSASTQYVSTPLADLMFKFSIGMAKPSKSATNNNSVNNVLNDIDAKTE